MRNPAETFAGLFLIAADNIAEVKYEITDSF